MNADLARCFERIADLLEITGADTFRVNSYRRVARIIRDLTDDIRTLQAAGKVQELAGIGKSTAAKIEEFLLSGTIALLCELESQVPSGLPALLAIPGMGPKTVALVHEHLKVQDLEDLKRVIASGELTQLPGMGEARVARIAEGLAFIESTAERTALGLARVVADELVGFLRARPDVNRVELAGSLRRGAETIGDVDLLCASAPGEDGAAIVQAFSTHALVKNVLAAGSTKGSVLVDTREGRPLQVDLRVVPGESFGAAWQYFTGSKEHNIRLREIAVRRGWKLNEWGLFEGDQRLAGSDEAEVYGLLGLPWIPPELREDRSEFQTGFDFTGLLQSADMRGDLHVHTTASDGVNSIEEMAAAAQARGYAYLAIADHSRSSTIANGLSVERMLEHIPAIRAAAARIKGLRVLVSCECDILSDGTLDYPDEILAQCDIVTASVHSAMAKGRKSPTERTIAAMHNRYVDVIGHPTGRLINRRPPMEMDMAAVIAAAVEQDVALELNASWQRLDLKDLHVRQALEAGAKIMINTDAHAADQLPDMGYGVTTARRGGARPEHVLNTRPWPELHTWLQRRR